VYPVSPNRPTTGNTNNNNNNNLPPTHNNGQNQNVNNPNKNPNQRVTCGTPAVKCTGKCYSKDVGGIQAVQNEFPWLVSITD